MRKLITMVALVSLVACAPPKMSPEETTEACGPEPDMAQAERAVKAWVERGGLKDPFSAQTRDIRIVGRGGIQNGVLRGGEWKLGWIVAFHVNAKNSFGAYVGWRERFVIWNRSTTYWSVSPTDMEPIPPTRL